MSSAKTPKLQTNFSETLQVGSPARAKLRAQINPRVTHGGIPSLRKRKTLRPFSPSAPVHLVLSSKRARGTWSLSHRKNRARVNAMIYVYAKRFKVRVYRATNLGHQIQLLVKATEKKNLADFLRVLAGRIAVVVSGAQKHIKRIGRFWDYLYWSKLINFGAEFFHVRKFLEETRRPVVVSGLVNDLAKEWELHQPGK
jgi:hypothetical protein